MKTLKIIANILLILTGINAIAAGYSFIADPTGGGLGISVDYLKHASFSNFLIPGLVLFTVIGLGALFTAYAALTRKKYYALLYLAYGATLSGWIIIQYLMLQAFHPLQAVFFSIGLFLTIVGRLQFSSRL